jgi:hypothetical protein
MHAPAVVSEVALEANGKVTAADNCKVTDVKAADGKMSFTRLDEALPMVVSADQKPLLPYLDNLSGLNRYGLKISGLEKDRRYEILIDGKTVAELTGEELGKGANLAIVDLGPITAQSTDVWKALVNKNQLLRWRFNTFRRNPVPFLSEDEQKEIAPIREKEVAVVDKALERLQKKVYEAAQPKPHQFEVQLVK